jgi:adenosylhomocysteine nucleosidase
MSRIAIIVAMERELTPLVRGWKRSSLDCAGRALACFETQTSEGQEMVAVAGGIGCKNAEQAARAVVAQYHPEILVSAGLAGALIRSLKVGSIVTPNVIVDAATGIEYRCATGGGSIGGGILVSADEVAGADAKQKLVESFHALIVDMEAAGVARVAQQAGLAFRCVKSISDEADFVMPPLNRFVDAEGRFQAGRFAGWAAFRPYYWAKIAALGRNSRRATDVLCEWLRKNVSSGLPAGKVVTLEGAEFSEAKN